MSTVLGQSVPRPLLPHVFALWPPTRNRGDTDRMGSVSGTDGNRGGRLLRVEPVDPYPWWTGVALVSAAMIVVLAVAGLPPARRHGPVVRWHAFGVSDQAWPSGEAVHYNPVAPLVPLGILVIGVRGAVGRLSGRWITPSAPRGAIFACCAAVALLALEINQQLNADLLSSRWPT